MSGNLSIKSFARDFLYRAPVRYIDNRLFNALFGQVFRIGWIYLSRGLRRLLAGKHCDSEVASQLARDGIVTIENFLPAEQFARLKALVLENIEQGDLAYEYPETRLLHLYKLDMDGFAYLCPEVRELAESEELRRWTAELNGCTPRIPPQLYINQHRRRDGQHYSEGQRKEYQETAHADVPYPSIKMILTLTETTEANGAFRYRRGSNRMTLRRVLGEYLLSLSYHRRRREGELVPEADPEYFLCEGLEPVVAAENTLVIFDARGFHARGPLQEGEERRVLFIDPRYTQSPVNSLAGLPLLGRFFRKFRYEGARTLEGTDITARYRQTEGG